MKVALVSLILLLPLLAPTGAASFSDSRQWHAYAVGFTDANGVVSATSFSLHSSPHSFTVTGRISLMEVSVAFTTTPASPATIDDYLAALIIKEGSTTRITCDGMSFSRANIPDTGRLQFSFLSFCHGTGSDALVPGTTYTYETTVTMVSGTNHIVNSGWSVKVEQTDLITDTTLDPLRTRIDAVSARVNTTCQKSTNDDCEGIKAALVYRTNQTNTYLNLTRQDIQNLTTLIMGNLTIGNLTINGSGLDTIIQTELVTAMNPIADSIGLLFWLALIAVAFLIAFRTEWGGARFVSIGLFVISIFVGLAVLDSYGTGPIALLIGLLGIAVASATKKELAAHGKT